MGYKCTVLTGHQGSVSCAAKVKSSSINTFITGSYDHSIRLWDINSTKCVRLFEGHAQPITSVKVAHYGPVALSGSKDNTLRLWNLEEGKCVNVYSGHDNTVTDIHIDKERILSCSNDGSIKVWDERTSLCTATLSGHNGKVKCMQVGAVRDSTVKSSQNMFVRFSHLTLNSLL